MACLFEAQTRVERDDGGRELSLRFYRGRSS
jgi:hypothetical protein